LTPLIIELVTVDVIVLGFTLKFIISKSVLALGYLGLSYGAIFTSVLGEPDVTWKYPLGP